MPKLQLSKFCKVEVEYTMSKTTAVEGFRRFNNDETNLEDQSSSGCRPSIMNIKGLREMPEQQLKTGTRIVSAELGSSRSTIGVMFKYICIKDCQINRC